MARDRLVRLVPAGPRLLVAVLAVAVAYHFSLQTLAAGWRYDTPLADLVLVPPLGALLLFAAGRRYRYVGFLRLGRLDFLIAGLLLAPTLVLVAAGPALWSKYFWAARVDLLTLPFFAAAGIVLLFGVRALAPLAFPLLFLLLAWPLPYLALLERTLTAFTGWTATAVEQIASRTHIAATVSGSDGSRYIVTHHGKQVIVSIASACSGANSLIGFVVVGIAALWFVHGRLRRRLAWLLAGAALVWTFNVLRILAVLLAAHRLGAHVAFDLLHPVAGIVSLNLSFLIAVWALPLFGLRRRRLDELEIVDTPLARAAAPQQQATPRKTGLRIAVLLAASVLLALADSQLSRAAEGYDNAGRPALTAVVEHPTAGRGWSVQRAQKIDWAAQYYGRDSTWVRYRLRPEGATERAGRFTTWVDAILSPNLGALDAYTLAHCYSFHGFHVEVSRRVDLGSDVIGQLFVYNTDDATWHVVAWQWPVIHSGHVDHERVVLLASTIGKPRERTSLQSGWLTDHLLHYLNRTASDGDSNTHLSRALTAVAGQMVAARIDRGIAG